MVTRLLTFLIISLITVLVGSKGKNPTTLFISQVVFFISLIALLAYIPHPDVF